ncbi:MAG: efflux RND transporter periplasmic adaptor subunit [Deltaproteobacteria bacterium]|nr:efflux RND transporter periplasmic adaptor subunit [Deltaproteobacteria bacterium]
MNIRKPILILILLAATLYTGYQFGRTSHPEKSPAMGKSSANGGRKARKVKYWQAPMDPTYIRDKPGKSPMGMDLIPVYEGEEDKSEPGTIRIDPVTVQDIGVRTAPVERRALSRTIRTVGRVGYDERRVEHIHTKMEGWVEKLYVDFLGQDVDKGTALLSIYSPELVSTQQEYLLALKYKKSLGASPFSTVSEGADTLLSSTRKRLELFDITSRQIDQIEKSNEIRKDLVLHSPTRGVVIDKKVQEGMYVKPGMNLYTIADISDVWVYADIYEYELPWLRLGQDVKMTLSYLPGRAYRGKISYIYPFLDKKTRTVKVRMEFRNPDWKLKPDMYANVSIRSRVSKSTLVIPEEAILRSGEKNIVILSRGEGKFLPRDVKLGAEGEGYYQILSGLTEGERVVTSAQFLIDSESNLKEAINKMLEAKKVPAKKTAMKEMKNMKGMKTAPPLPETIRTSMERILEDYLVIQRKLKSDTLEGIKPSVVEMATLAEKIKVADKDRSLAGTTRALTVSAPELLSGNIKTVRKGFKTISQALADYVKDRDPKGARALGLSIFYCPMVKEPWLQKGTTAENPYLGKKMLNCGNEISY